VATLEILEDIGREYGSPRGCRGRFGSSGATSATRIEADFTGVDCTTTFTGRVVLTKD
jgi:hypothetical protein